MSEEIAWWDFEKLYPGGLSYTHLRQLIHRLGQADGRFVPFSIYEVRANPSRWAIEIVDQVNKTLVTASDFAKFENTWPSLPTGESWDRTMELQAVNIRGCSIQWPQVQETLLLLERLYPSCGLLAVYGNLPTLTYSVLIYTPDQKFIPCETPDDLAEALGPFSAAG